MQSLKALGLAAEDFRPDEDNVVYYQIHFPRNADEARREELRLLLLDITARCAKGRIWQRECFSLTLSSQKRPSWWSAGMPPGDCLWGATLFGDNVADEWFIVALLERITSQIPDLAARVWDNDGEFVLIEAAYQLPGWLKPETSANRLWLYNGEWHLVPLPSSSAQGVPTSPSCTQALDIVRSNDIPTLVKPQMSAAIRNRTAGLLPPLQLRSSSSMTWEGICDGSRMHAAAVRVPLTVAHLLDHEPQLVAPAVEAFYTRDPAAVKAASQMKVFPPTDMVDSCVCFNRTLYAQLKLQSFQAFPGYPMPPDNSSQHAAAEVGMKVTAGFEMLYASLTASLDPATMDIAQTTASSMSLEHFINAVRGAGNETSTAEPTSQESRALTARFEAVKGYQATVAVTSDPLPVILRLLQKVPTKAKYLGRARWCPPPDSDAWLSDSGKELEDELQRAEATSGSCQPGASGDDDGGVAQIEAVNRRMQDFLLKQSGHEGAEVAAETAAVARNQVGTADKEGPITFNPAVFGRAITEYLRSERHLHPPAASSEGSDILDDFYDGSETTASESTSSAHRGTWEDKHTDTDSDDETHGKGFMSQYGSAMDDELAGTAMGKSFERMRDDKPSAEVSTTPTTKPSPTAAPRDLPDPGSNDQSAVQEELKPVDVDLNLVSSMLASFESQHGLPGPVTNMAGMLGMRMPPVLDRSQNTTTQAADPAQTCNSNCPAPE